MTHSEAREFIRNHFEEFVNKKNVDIGNVNFARDFVDHGADVPVGMPPGPAGAIQYVAGALKRYPDLHIKIEDMIAEDDKVAVRLTAHGTHRGDFMGLPATGKQYTISETHIFHMRDGKVAEHWRDADMLGLMRQLGGLPSQTTR